MRGFVDGQDRGASITGRSREGLMIGRKFGPAVHPRSALFRGTCVATCVTATAQRQRGSAVFVLLRGAAANAAGALDDAIAYDRSTADSLAEGRGFEPLVPREKSDSRARGTSGSNPLPFTRHGSTLSPRRLAAFLSPCETALRREQRQRHSRFLFRFWLLRLFSFPVGSSLPFCHNTLPYVDHPGSIIYSSIIWERFRICSANLKSSKRCGPRAIIVG